MIVKVAMLLYVVMLVKKLVLFEDDKNSTIEIVLDQNNMGTIRMNETNIMFAIMLERGFEASKFDYNAND